MVDLLVRYGADVNASWTRASVVGKLVETPLSEAYAKGHFRVGEFLESIGARGQENQDIDASKEFGRIKKSVDGFLDRPPPEYIDPDQWRRIALKTAFAEVKPELARWFEDMERLNPEAMQTLTAVSGEPPPQGIDELQWAQHQVARVNQMVQSRELTFEIPRKPPPQ